MRPLISILCYAYNHAEFISDAIEGFLSQKSEYPYEIIIHDDCSTDGTDDIIKRYAKKYPDLIFPFYEEKNCYSQGIKFVNRLLDFASGKYIAICEGDDYWCDCSKLQKQISYMESHDNCSLCIHNGFSLNYDTGLKKAINPYKNNGILEASDIIKEGKAMPPTASMVYRKDDIINMPQFFRESPVGDRPKRMYLALKGYAYYFSDIMCVYRVGTPGSFGKRTQSNKDYSKNILNRMLEFYDKYDEYTEGKYKNELDFVRSREWFHYYQRIGEHCEAYKTLYFKSHFNIVKRMEYRIYNSLPQHLKKTVREIIK